MQKLYIKVIDFEKESQSLIVSFASDETNSSNPGDYSATAFQPGLMWPDITDEKEIMQKIALDGFYMVKNQKLIEDSQKNIEKMNEYQKMVGKTFEFNVDEIINVNDFTPTNEIIL